MEISLKGRVWHQACPGILAKKRKINWDTEGKLLEGPPRSCLCNASKLREKGMLCVLLELDCFARKKVVHVNHVLIQARVMSLDTKSHENCFPVDLCPVFPLSFLTMQHPSLCCMSACHVCLSCSPFINSFLLAILVSDHIPIFKLGTFWPSTIDDCWDHTVALHLSREH